MSISLVGASPEGRKACQALLQDEQTPCTAIAHGSKCRYCMVHAREYKDLTQKYKIMSKTADILQKHAQLTESQLSTLVDAAAVDAAILSVQFYIDAIEEEIEGRRVHHKRFFQTKDEGHERWFGFLIKKRASAELSMARLRRQRESIVAGDARQGEECRRHVAALAESQHIAAATANRERELTKVVERMRRALDERIRYLEARAESQRMATAAHQERESIKVVEDARRREEQRCRHLEAPARAESQRRAVVTDQERRAREAVERRAARPLVQNPPSRPAASWRTDLEAQTEVGERVPLVASRAEPGSTCDPLTLVVLFFIVVWAVRSLCLTGERMVTSEP